VLRLLIDVLITSSFQKPNTQHGGVYLVTMDTQFRDVTAPYLYLRPLGRNIILPVSKKRRRPCWNSTSGFDFNLSSSSACQFASAYQISSRSDHPHHSYNTI